MSNNGAGKAKNRFKIVHDASSSCSLSTINNRAIVEEEQREKLVWKANGIVELKRFLMPKVIEYCASSSWENVKVLMKNCCK